MATSKLPVVLPPNGDDPRQLGAGEVLDGSAKWLDVVGLQGTGLVGGLVGIDTIVAGSDFVWSKDYLPAGRSLYLEVVASGSAVTTQVQVSLYTAGATPVQVVASLVSTTGIAANLARSSAFSLTDGATYQVHYKSVVLGTATLKLARLIIL